MSSTATSDAALTAEAAKENVPGPSKDTPTNILYICTQQNTTLGHVDGFSDPMVDCKETKLRYRADQLFYSPILVGEDILGYVCVQETDDATMLREAKKQAEPYLAARNTSFEDVSAWIFKEVVEATPDELAHIPSPATGVPGTLTPPRDFNLMFETNVGAAVEGSTLAYLRPETAQGIFLNFKTVLATSRLKIPFGIAQIGKAFRNEITPRNFIFRSREFEQMEVEYFIPPRDETIWQPYHQQWMQDSMNFLLSMGLNETLLGWDIHEQDKLAHYARACTDITFQFPFGTQELMGIAARGDYDLVQHSDGSGKSTNIQIVFLCLCCLFARLLFPTRTFVPIVSRSGVF